MRPIHRHVLLVLFTLLGAMRAAPVHAQGDNGFLRGEKHADVALTYSRESFQRFWLGRSIVRDPGVGTIIREGYNLYSAYGVTNELDFVFSGSYVIASSTRMIPTEDDFQDAVLGIKWQALKTECGEGGSASFLLAPAIKFPTSEYHTDTPTAVGDGQTDYRARVIGHYQHASGFFFAVETGYDHRDGRTKDELPLNISAGATLFGRWTLTPYFSLVNSLGGQDIGQTPFPRVEEDQQRIGLGTYIRLTDHFGLTGNIFSVVGGQNQNTGDAAGFSAGVVLRF